MDLVKKKDKAKEPALNVLKKLYENYKDKNISDDEAFLKFDLTQEIFRAMQDIIDNREAWNSGVLGGPTTGKSTVMFLLVDWANTYMSKKKLLFKREDGSYDKTRLKGFNNYNQVVADQIEFVGLVKKELWSCFIGIDEYNRLGDTGLNSSVETTLFATYSDIFAQQHVNRVSCSPSVVNDINCWLILEVYGTNKKEKITTCKVVYRDIISGRRQCIGHANFFVGDIIKDKSYVRYRKKKFKRMELLQKHGIRKISELDFSEIILGVYNELKEIAIGDRKVDPDVVLSAVKRIIREKRFIGSLIAESDIASSVRGMLGLLHNINKDKKRMDKENAKDEPDEDLIKEIKIKIKKYKKELDAGLNEQKRLAKIYQEYITIK